MRVLLTNILRHLAILYFFGKCGSFDLEITSRNLRHRRCAAKQDFDRSQKTDLIEIKK